MIGGVFGAYYEGGRDGFVRRRHGLLNPVTCRRTRVRLTRAPSAAGAQHLGVNEHCDGGANLVSTIVHAVLPDGDVGFSTGGELTVSETSGHAAAPIPHSNATVGSVVYLGSSVFHHASPINAGGKRLVFCLFYAGEGDLSKHALA